MKIQSEISAGILEGSLDMLPHPAVGVLHLTLFKHDSDGVRKLKKQMAEAIVLKLESSGIILCNGLSEMKEHLEANGYTVSGLSTGS